MLLAPLGLSKGPLIPVQAQPLEALEDRFFGLAGGAFEVCVLDAEHEAAPVAPGIGPVVERGSGAPEMQKPRGAWCESSSDC